MVIVENQTWADYEVLLEQRGDLANPKIYFDAKTKEIRQLCPSLPHSHRSNVLSTLVECLLFHQKKDWQSFTRLTLTQPRKQSVDFDACFYIENRQAVLGKEKIDLEIDPPPDLALEVDLNSLTQPRAYESIAAPELWIYREGALHIYLFENGRYVESTTSATFPNVPVATLMPEYVEKAWHEGTSVAVRAFRERVRSSL